MGTRGPVPKPNATRRRTNKPEIPVKKATRGAKKVPAAKPAPTKRTRKAASAPVVVAETPETKIARPEQLVYPPNEKWHPVALAIYVSLIESGQSEFYEASDWSIAYMLCESISRDLGPQVVGVTPSGKILRDIIPMKGASLSAYMKGFTDLLMSEGARRRASVELTRGDQVDPHAERASATVTDIRSRLTGG